MEPMTDLSFVELLKVPALMPIPSSESDTTDPATVQDTDGSSVPLYLQVTV